MALHKADRKVISPDVLAQRSGLGTVSIAPVNNDQSAGKIYMKNNQIIVNDGTYDRILIGFQLQGF